MVTRSLSSLAVLSFALLSPAAAWADLKFLQPVADAGEVRSGRPLTHHFLFTNEGPETVQITGMRASCGCVRPRLEKRAYAPGEKGQIDLEVRTLSQPAGDQAWQVEVAWKDGAAERQATLVLRAKVVVEVSVQPAALTLTTDRTVRHEITLTDARPQPLSVTSVRTSSAHLKAEVVGMRPDEMGRRLVTVGLVVMPSCPDGRHEETVVLATSDELYRELTVPVTVVKRPTQGVTASPASIFLLAPAGQAAPSRIALLRPVREGTVVIDAIEADDPAVQCRWAAGPNNLATLRVTFDRTKLAGDALRTAIHVRLRGPTTETVTIPVHCHKE